AAGPFSVIRMRNVMRVVVARVLLRRRIVSRRMAVSILLGIALSMCIVDRVLDMLARGPTRLAPECKEHQAPGIEAGQQRCERADPEGCASHFGAAREGGLEDRIL